MRSAVPASFMLLPPSSPQFLALVPVILAAAVLTLPQAPDLDALDRLRPREGKGEAATFDFVPLLLGSTSDFTPGHWCWGSARMQG